MTDVTRARSSNRITDWLYRLSVGNRLLAGFGLTTALFVVTLLMTLLSAQRSEVALEQLVFGDARIAALWDEVESAINRTRLRESQFLLHYRELGFNEARNRYVTLEKTSLADAFYALAEIRAVVGGAASQQPYSMLVETTHKMETSLGVYQKEFLAAVTAIGVIGSLDSGLLGTMRAAAHQMEAVIKRQGDATMMVLLMQIRRTEKDTQLRSVESDGLALFAAITAFRRQLAVARMPIEARNELSEILGSYEAATRKYFDTDAVVRQHTANYQVAVIAWEHQ